MKLKPNKKYRLTYSDEFCQMAEVDFPKENRIRNGCPAIFVGRITLSSGERNVFYVEGKGHNIPLYIMLSNDNLEESCQEITEPKTIEQRLADAEARIKQLESVIDP